MQTSWRNICKIGRQAAGMTQERWAEALEVSVEAVRGYEAGLYMPSDDLALRMADIAAMPVLSHWHLLNKSAAARALIPDVKYLGASRRPIGVTGCWRSPPTGRSTPWKSWTTWRSWRSWRASPRRPWS